MWISIKAHWRLRWLRDLFRVDRTQPAGQELEKGMPTVQPWPNAAEMLAGRALDGGWRVTEKLIRPPHATGGNFCIGYLVEHEDGRQGFLKALDIGRAAGYPDPAWLLQELVAGYNFERQLLEKCKRSRMSRVVLVIAHGVVTVPDTPIPNVNYIIFERADGDIRSVLNAEQHVDLAARLRALHHIATGIWQLHRQGIAHQDVKPSNVLVFSEPDIVGKSVSKIADLGRATDRRVPATHDEFLIAGDPTYAPPEQLYGATPETFDARRFACDLYQLGSLATFIFTGVTMNAMLAMELHPCHSWQNWGSGYEEVLPYVRDAFGRSLRRIREDLPVEMADRVIALISYLCDPDPSKRGHRITRTRPGNNYNLERVVSDLDLACRRAELYLTRVASQ